MPFLTSREAKNLCLIIQACDSSLKKDSLEAETSSQPENDLSFPNEEVDSSDNFVRHIGHLNGINVSFSCLSSYWQSTKKDHIPLYVRWTHKYCFADFSYFVN